jgi:RimJ/RimL family protein N-acetyltransferase
VFPSLPLLTKRLILRLPDVDDAADLFGIFSDAAVMRYWATPPWTSPEQARGRIEADLAAASDGSALRLHVRWREGGPVIGAVTLFGFVKDSQRAETGYILGRKAWGAGVATEAMRALIDYGFGQLSLRRIEADVDPRNQRSCGLLRRLGFVEEGLLRQRWVVAGEISDSALYGLLSTDWAASAGVAGIPSA